jgi:molecular chaperone GrpE
VAEKNEQTEKAEMPQEEAAKEEVEKPEEAAVEEISAEEAAEVEEVSELEALRQELEKAKAQAAEYLEGWQRTQAEFANFKKRNEQERKELLKVANATLITKLLPIFDDFERAFQTLPSNLLRLTWIDGIALIYRRLQAILEGEGLTLIETEGQDFDPLLHEAVTYEESDDHEEGQIIGEVQKGYKLGDRVLRPALVRVAKGKPAPEAEGKGDSD